MTTPHLHAYDLALAWGGNGGPGTVDYATYPRSWRVAMPGKPDLSGSADPTFRGDARLHNPEEMLVVAVSSCHMLSYLALCARARVRVVEYTDEAHGVMETRADGGGSFKEITLRPRVVVARALDVERARELHGEASRQCYIAGSCNFPIHHVPTIEVA